MSDQERDCLTNLRFADDVMLFATYKEQLQNMMYDFKKATEKVGLKIHPDKTKILSNQSNMNSNTKRYIKVGDMSIEVLTKKRKRDIFGSENLVPPTRDTGNQEQDQSSLGDIPQIQTRIDIKKIHAQTPSSPLRRHSFSDSMLRSRNMDTEQRTRKNDSIDATQDATTHHPDEKKNTRKLKSKLLSPEMRKELLTRLKIAALMMKAVMVRAQNLKMMWDSGVTFVEDSEKDIDTIEIEEEDWIDYIKRSTADALDKMEHAKIRCWNRTHKKK